MPTPVEELRAQILIAPHTDMEPHVRRQAFLLLDRRHDLAEVAHKMALNDQGFIANLVETALLRKASTEDLEIWRREKRFFRFLIVQPFVLAQDFDSDFN
jgi:hypothetical protein